MLKFRITKVYNSEYCMGRFLTQKLSTAEASCDDVLYLSFPTITARNKFTVISQNKVLFRVFSSELRGEAARRWTRRRRPASSSRAAGGLLLLLADAGLDHGGVDACVEDSEYYSISRKMK